MTIPTNISMWKVGKGTKNYRDGTTVFKIKQLAIDMFTNGLQILTTQVEFL
jgi:hypothetical protein